MANLLILTIFMPLVGACLVPVLAPMNRAVEKWVALIATVVTLLLAGVLIVNFNTGEEANFVTHAVWLDAAGVKLHFSVGLDGLSLWLFGLSALLMPTAVLVSWNSIKERPTLFYVMLLLLECGCLGVFVARDLMLFYVFFEFTLIPLFFLIGIWGSEQRRLAAIKFFIYTLAGSVLTFLGLLAVVALDAYNSPDAVAGLRFTIPELTRSLSANPLPVTWQVWIFLGLLAGFAIKVPLFPFHTWLPLAHVQAPTAGSVFLAGVLLKIGTYGLVRFSLPMLPDAAAIMMPYMLWLAAIGIVYGALVALAQTDIKRLIAYSSVSHLGFCVLGLFALNPLGLQGGTLQMVNHGLSTGGLFALVGMLYERYHTREIAAYSGIARKLPLLSTMMLLFTFSSIGLPGLNGFAGEFLLLLGMFLRAFNWEGSPEGLSWQLKLITLMACSGVVLGAWYMLLLMQRVFFGPLKETHAGHGSHEPVKDLNFREIMALAPLLVFVVWIGVQPKFFLDRMEPALQSINAAVQRPFEEEKKVADESAVETPVAATVPGVQSIKQVSRVR